MNRSIDCLPFPGKVIRGAGALIQTGAVCGLHGQRVFALGGKTALAKTKQPLAQAFSSASAGIVATEWYGGEVTRDNIERLAHKAKELKADVILAIGGG